MTRDAAQLTEENLSELGRLALTVESLEGGDDGMSPLGRGRGGCCEARDENEDAGAPSGRRSHFEGSPGCRRDAGAPSGRLPVATATRLPAGEHTE